MPAYLKSRSSPKAAQKPKKRDIPPTLPIGSPYLPNVNVPEPATLIGDETGTEYIRMGDNPNGPEQLQVTPPGGGVGARMPVGKGGPVSMALGGTATVGGTKYNPTQAALDMNRWRRGKQASIFAQRKNVQDLEAVAKGQAIQGSEMYKYSAAGVTPARINLPRGASAASLNPSVIANFQTEASRQEQEYAEENALKTLDMEAEGLQNTLNQQAQAGVPGASMPGRQYSRGPLRPGEPGSITAFQADQARIAQAQSASKEAPPGMAWYTPPNGAAPRLVKETEASILEARDKQLLQEEYERRYPDPDKAPDGQTFYDNPFTPQLERELLTPAEAAMRKARDQDLIEQQFGSRYPGAPKVQKLSEAQIVEAHWRKLPGYEDRTAVIAALVAMGWTPEAADILISNGQPASTSALPAIPE